ncbi:hypothetical protein GMD78_03840 [Ornithinibacillus sp. L9]|uniref:Uncharacterized protein n=1 Tax=Ornithinibacillus caprae TaxID=2678566 RepID=A0A6N8FCY8_9BACI|nr:hypothetical protein [Ornithinibacillus caprae]MUK87532.1 hypothetical protein [Ornithinibacillus caprae]
MKRNGSCLDCGKIDSLLNNLCEDCYEKEAKLVKQVKTFLTNNPNSNAIDISLETGIAIDKITRLIKKGTLR